MAISSHIYLSLYLVKYRLLFYKKRLIIRVSYALGTSFASKLLHKLDVRAPFQCFAIKIKRNNLIKKQYKIILS